MKANKTMIYSDMDGTLLTSWNKGPVISEKNEIAIKKYISEGGLFSIATGRNLKNGPTYLTNYDIQLPMVLVNGALIYDRDQAKVIQKKVLPSNFVDEALEYFATHFRVGLIISDVDEVYKVVRSNEVDGPKVDEPEFDFITETVLFEDVTKLEILKMTYITHDHERVQIEKELSFLKTISQVKASPSSSRFIEIVEKSVNKAVAIKEVLSLYNVQDRALVCVGDYLNDLEMLDIADIAAIPENGLDVLKRPGRLIISNHDENSLADLIIQLKELNL